MTIDIMYYPPAPEEEVAPDRGDHRAQTEMRRDFDASLAMAPWAALYLDLFAERRVSASRQAASEFLDGIAIRLKAVESTQQQLSTEPPSTSFELGSYLRTLAGYLASVFPASRATFIFDFDSACRVDAEQVTAICVIVSEVIINSMQQSQLTDRPSRIVLAYHRCDEDLVVLWVVDDGVGPAKNFDLSDDGSVGSRVLELLSRQLGATYRFEPTDLGMQFRLELPAASCRAG